MAMNMDAMLRIRADVQGENNIRRLGNSMQGLQGQAKNAALALSGLRAGIAGVVGLVGGGVIVGKIFGDTATLQSQARSLQVLTGSAKVAAGIVKELQSYGAATPFESTELIETAKRLSAFGVSTEQLVATIKRLGDVAGATGANLGELATAYGQVVAKGRLQGEELLQFQERGVALSEELKEMYKLQGQEFTKALEGGRISAEAVEVAIERLTEKGGKYADGAIAQSDTLNGRLSTLKDTVTALSQTIGKVLEPALQSILTLATTILDNINAAIKQAINGTQNAETIAAIRAGKLPFGGVEAIDKVIGEARRRQLGQQAGPGWFGLGVNTDNLIKLLQQQPEFRVGATPSSRQTAIPQLLPGRASAGNSADAAARRAASDAQRAADRYNDGLQGAIELAGELTRKIKDVKLATQDVGADAADGILNAFQADLNAIQNEQNNLIKKADEFSSKTGLQFEGLRNKIKDFGVAQVAQAEASREQGLKDLLPNIEDYNKQIREATIQAENRKLGIEGLTEVQKLNLEIELLGLDALALINPALAEHIKLLRGRAAALDAVTEKQKKDSESINAGIKQNLQDYYNSVKDLGSAVGSAVTSGLQGLEDKLTEFVTTGKASFRELAASVVSDLARIALQAAVIKPLLEGIGGPTGLFPNLIKFANGGIMTGDGSVPLKKYASGGIARSPQLALYGEGSMAEAYVPLPDGRRIPVAMQGGGGGSTVVNVSVDAKGTSVQGNSGQGAQLGRAISQAVQAELVKQRRPGGLLAAA